MAEIPETTPQTQACITWAATTAMPMAGVMGDDAVPPMFIGLMIGLSMGLAIGSQNGPFADHAHQGLLAYEADMITAQGPNSEGQPVAERRMATAADAASLIQRGLTAAAAQTESTS